jgi:hypothetical protein
LRTRLLGREQAIGHSDRPDFQYLQIAVLTLRIHKSIKTKPLNLGRQNTFDATHCCSQRPEINLGGVVFALPNFFSGACQWWTPTCLPKWSRYANTALEKSAKGGPSTSRLELSEREKTNQVSERRRR